MVLPCRSGPAPAGPLGYSLLLVAVVPCPSLDPAFFPARHARPAGAATGLAVPSRYLCLPSRATPSGLSASAFRLVAGCMRAADRGLTSGRYSKGACDGEDGDHVRQPGGHGCLPKNCQEYRQALSHGCQVVTTDAQRRQWGVEPHERLPVLSPDQATRILFADPGDPVLDPFDPSMVAFDDDEDLEMAVDGRLSVNPSRQAARDAGPADGSGSAADAGTAGSADAAGDASAAPASAAE